MKALTIAGVFAILVAACGGTAAPSAAPASASTAAKSAAPSAAAMPPVKFNWTAVSGASSGLWTAYEAGYFKDEGLDVTLEHVASSSRAVAALIADDFQFTHLDGEVDIDANLTGGDIRLVYAITNRLVFSIMSKKTITKPDELKGKKLGITRAGSSTDTAARLALDMWHLSPQTDVTLIPLTEVPSIFTALSAGQIDAGVMSPPTNYRAKTAGFYELINLATDGPEWPSVGIGVTEKYVKAHPDVVLHVIRAYSKGVHRFKTDKPFALTVLKKYLKTDDQGILENTYEQFSKYLVDVPHVKGMENTIKEVAKKKPKAADLKMSQLIDDSFVTQLEQQGFYKQLWGK